jgi:hypothetical protein
MECFKSYHYSGNVPIGPLTAICRPGTFPRLRTCMRRSMQRMPLTEICHYGMSHLLRTCLECFTMHHHSIKFSVGIHPRPKQLTYLLVVQVNSLPYHIHIVVQPPDRQGSLQESQQSVHRKHHQGGLQSAPV